MYRRNSGWESDQYSSHRPRGWLPIAAAAVSAVVTAAVLFTVLTGTGDTRAPGSGERESLALMDRYDMAVGNALSDALEGVMTLDKVYWLPDDASAGPKPNPACAGEASDPAEMESILEDARNRLNIDHLIFSPETEIMEGSAIQYYLDDTIFSVSWKQVMDNCVYSFAEVKIGHPSQFRRFLSGGDYGTGYLYKTSAMAASVNAVTASSADYYAYRPGGITVYNGDVRKVNGSNFDVCFIDRNGDLLFSPARTLTTKEAVEAFVKEHGVKFSLCFGPILIEDGRTCTPNNYEVGEINKQYSRAAIAQEGPLHYVIAMANMEGIYRSTPDIHQFAENLQKAGLQKAYALDGGQTATLYTNHKVFNMVSYGDERLISDIIYFATAIPEAK